MTVLLIEFETLNTDGYGLSLQLRITVHYIHNLELTRVIRHASFVRFSDGLRHDLARDYEF